MMENKELVSALNELIQTCKDGEHGFHACAEDLHDPQLKRAFIDRADGCAAAAGELQELVRSLGGVPEISSSMSGTLHRRWVNIKALITGKDNVSVLKECERGEDVALQRYRAVLEKGLPEHVRSVVERQLQGVQYNHDRVRHLRESAEAAAKLNSQ